jgi:ATP-dependent Clp protease ATP-binding subunit ClpA
VHDLFLQILDEGFFSDVRGKRVNARDVIFIATSNAGSQLIFKRMQEGVDTTNIQKEVIDHIISEQIFKPEFLNRFDAVVLFHPLLLPHIQQISALMLNKLKTRLRGRGFDLSVTNELVNYVARQGLDPVFGARPMNRYIQEHVEQVVAEKLIRGEIKEGSRFTLAPSELG